MVEDIWMDGNKYMEGFVFCTRYYYRYGHLDIPVDAVTQKGFCIGQWLEDLRRDIDNLTSFQINDMSSIGMIWDASKLGGHQEFTLNLRKLESIAKEHKGEVRTTDIPDKDPLRKWCEMLPIWRKQGDNSLLTMRECELITATGFIWSGLENSEYTQMTKNNSLLVQAIRRDAMKILKEKGYMTSRGRMKEEAELEEAIHRKQDTIVKSSDWRTVLLTSYLKGKDTTRVTPTIREVYLASCKLTDKNSPESFFLQMLNDGQPGFAQWIILTGKLDLDMDVDASIAELNNWSTAYENLGGYYKENPDELITEHGSTVGRCLSVIKAYKDEDVVKKNLKENVWKVYFDNEKIRKPRKQKAAPYKPVVFVEADFFEDFTKAIDKFAGKYGFAPNCVEEIPASYEDHDSFSELLAKALEGEEWLNRIKYRYRVRRYGLFFYKDKPGKDEVAFRKAYWKFMNSLPMERSSLYPHPELLKYTKNHGTSKFRLDEFARLMILAQPQFKELWDVYNMCLPNEHVVEMMDFIPMYIKSMHYAAKRRKSKDNI